MENKITTGTAIGKIILIGEHAVVYGQPALAIPFPETRIKTIISRKRGPVMLDCFFYKGLLLNAPERLLGLTTIIKEIVNGFDKELKDFSIRIESSIPPERGMGSSAAVAVATVRALYDFFDQPLTDQDLFKWSNISEKIVHGNPSGIDTAIIIGETPLYYIKGKPFVPFPFKLDAFLIVADTGELGQTQAAVASVEKLMDTDPEKGEDIIKQLGFLTKNAKVSIESNDGEKLGETMSKAHSLLDKLGVSNEILNLLVSVAVENGALGAKLTGGGRGGCMIALAATQQEAISISNKLLCNGAKNTWIYNMGVDLL
ncbi:Mevalonate kinase [[Clostridium] ultunense Esp]|uniref:Mevalonate kinase n=1 Tax=[Clostridium] ultunense Esp TaxID=1288971 RepID=M1Z5L4_9FIRM|nr:mevalonate kinase [Schnuerera ultunensis]CCQ92833.1 Mevalonate kinase [[Clostridium] ultunense Esp]SHD75848.1 Mevalonate kinase [[Clostridium] ultunense Esp]